MGIAMNYIDNWLYQLTDALAADADQLPVSGDAIARLGLDAGIEYQLVIAAQLGQPGGAAFEILTLTGEEGGSYSLTRPDAQAWPSGALVMATLTAEALARFEAAAATAATLTAAVADLQARVAALEAAGGPTEFTPGPSWTLDSENPMTATLADGTVTLNGTLIGIGVGGSTDAMVLGTVPASMRPAEAVSVFVIMGSTTSGWGSGASAEVGTDGVIRLPSEPYTDEPDQTATVNAATWSV